MLKALYYPQTEIRSETILKNALLLWDSIETIVPSRGWTPPLVHGDKLFREAVDLVVQPRVPTTRERTAAAKQLRWLIERGFLTSVREATNELRVADSEHQRKLRCSGSFSFLTIAYASRAVIFGHVLAS